jgi:CubicO group peptidase (beta-lactamase class C family)
MRSRFTDTRAITVRDLLTHHAGLPGNYLHGMWNPEPEPVALLLQRLANEDVSFPPGHVLSYSNIGFDLLGLVIERVSGERYEDYVRRHVLEPLAMNSASIESGFSGANVARAYRDGKETPESPMRDVPAGGLNVSAIELTRFARMALNGGVLDGRNVLRAETLAEMWRAQNADVPLDFDHHVGLGWGVNRTGDLDIPGAGRVPHHSGGTLQFHSNLVVLPDDGLAVVVMANSAESGPAVSRITKTLITLALEARTGRTGRRDITSMRAATATATEDWSGHYDTLLGYSAIRSDGGDHYLDTFDKKFVLRRGDDGALHVRYRLFGFIPVSAPGLSHAAIARETIGNNVVLSAEEHGRRRLAGSLIQPNRIDAVWRARLGRYDFNNAGQDVLLFEQNELVERDGVLLWRRAHPLFGEGVATFALSPLSDTEAVVEGLGAGRGEVLRFDPVSGRLRYSGYELVRVP